MKNWLLKWLGITTLQRENEVLRERIDGLRESVRDMRYGKDSGITSVNGAIVPTKDAFQAIMKHLDIELQYTQPVQSHVVVVRNRIMDTD